MAALQQSKIESIIRQSPPIDVTQPFDPSTLRDKVILITGGANGLGAHMVREWASHGAHIIIGDVADALGEDLVATLKTKYPASTFAYQHCDVTDWESQVALFQTATRTSPTGHIDIIVPNAGIILPSANSIFEHPVLVDGVIPKPNLATLDVNISGVAYTTHLALFYLPKNPRSDRCILLIGSVASLLPLPGQAQYCMSKHAVLGLFRSLRATAFTNGVRVNMLAPFFTSKTNMLKPGVEAVFFSGSPGAGSVEDVIGAATRLIADETIAGRSLVIGPRIKANGVEGAEDFQELMASDEEGDGQGRPIWECYADDYQRVDTFVKRYLYILHVGEQVKGWFGIVTDLWAMLRRK
ncbi:hypothetical protein BGZ63DRAFT_411973 [Mariannaea sp. PMI_226]|nr:hypothetical protein BGZ63DRAFT_411973 [Mariannaea sp. PMI_226]